MTQETTNSAGLQGFGKWLRYTREQRGLNQTELAALVGRKQPAISKLEEGSLSPSCAICIEFAQVLDIPVEIVLAKAGMIDEATAICIQFAQAFDIPVEIILPKAGMIVLPKAGMIDEATAICIQFAQVFDIPVEIILPKAGMIDEAFASTDSQPSSARGSSSRPRLISM